MRLIKAALIGIGLLTAGTSFADCTRTSKGTHPINITFGNMVINQNAPVGSIVGTSQVFPMPSDNYYTHCKANSTEKLSLTYSPDNTTMGSYHTYPTGIDGLGFRLRLRLNKSESYFGGMESPHLIATHYTGVGNDWGISFSKYEIIADFVKTKPVISSGEMSNLAGVGGYISLARKPKDKPMVYINISGAASTVVINPSCSLENGNGGNLTVNLPTTQLSSFKHAGDTAGDKNFDLKLRCAGGNDLFKVNVSTSFSTGSLDPVIPSKAVFANEAPDASKAKGIGIQVLSEGNPITLSKAYPLGKLGSDSGSFTFPMTARYYQYEDKPTAGSVVSRMVYNIDYE